MKTLVYLTLRTQHRNPYWICGEKVRMMDTFPVTKANKWSASVKRRLTKEVLQTNTSRIQTWHSVFYGLLKIHKLKPEQLVPGVKVPIRLVTNYEKQSPPGQINSSIGSTSNRCRTSFVRTLSKIVQRYYNDWSPWTITSRNLLTSKVLAGTFRPFTTTCPLLLW